MERTVSSYKNYKNLPAGRTLFFLLVEYFAVLVYAVFFFAVAGAPILRNLPAITTSLSASQTVHKEMLQFEADSGLISVGEDGNAIASETTTNTYLLSLAKTAYFRNDEPFPKGVGSQTVTVTAEECLDYVDAEGHYTNDGILHYFYDFKPEHEGIDFYVYEGEDVSADKTGFLFDRVFVYDAEDFETYPELKMDKARVLADYLVRGERSSSTKAFYNKLYNSHQKATGIFIKEIEGKSVEYRDYVRAFNDYYSTYVFGYLLTLSLCIFMGVLANELIFPLIFRGQSLGAKIMKVGTASADEFEPAVWQRILKGFLKLLLQYSSLFFITFFLFSSNYLFYSFGGFLFFYLVAGSALMDLVSIILALAVKSHQGVAEGIAMLSYRDLRFGPELSAEEVVDGE